MNPSILSAVEMAARDPILGITEAYHADPRPDKINLGVGVYCDDHGRVPVLSCVHHVEQELALTSQPKNYLPIDGLRNYGDAVQSLLFGAASTIVHEGRAITVQALGGTGALKIGADFLRRAAPQAKVWISDPSWENHRAIFEYAGFEVHAYPYYDAPTRSLDLDAMVSALHHMPPGSICVLHACCHNPTGVDLSSEHWTEVIEAVQSRGLLPFLDIAYQGFADGLDADAEAVRRFAAVCPVVFIATSFSKSLSLYGERVGALTVVTASREESARALSQLKRTIRTNYSNPPTHGAQMAAMVLTNPELRRQWETELGEMRERIKTMRHLLVEKIRAKRADFDFSFVVHQRGMFSYSGLTQAQVHRLREEYSVYAVDSGRICVAALNSRNIDYAAHAIASVLT